MHYLKMTISCLVLSICICSLITPAQTNEQLPNIILLMADDLGYVDVAYNGNPTVKTPNLDNMARQGIRFDRFYSAGPVCTPTRASCLTGLNPARMNMTWASAGQMPGEEITLAEALKLKGYRTGHFGKWHLGQLSKTVKQSYSPYPADPERYSPPWENGFDVCFSVEASVPTFNPYYLTCGEYGSDEFLMVMNKPVEYGQHEGGFVWRDRFWTGPGQFHDEWLAGPLPEILMDRALDFIRYSVNENKPFLTLVWFSTPHTPVVSGPGHREIYSGRSIEEQHWFGSISAMDEQIGRLRSELEQMRIADNTIIWFCSDNGPTWVHDLNSAGTLKGKKASLWEGGIRVPAIMEWPGRYKTARIINTPVVTSDIFPTLLSVVGQKKPHDYPMDGMDITEIIEEKSKKRRQPIGFQSPVMAFADQTTQAWLNISGRQMVWMNDQYKLASFDDGETWMLFDILHDKREQKDVAAKFPEVAGRMKEELNQWLESCRESSEGKDY
jgi:arylsulfatase A-like enzyme